MKHYLSILIFVTGIALTAFYSDNTSITIAIIALLGAVYLAVTIAGVSIIKWNYFIKSINNAPAGKVVFTFDDSPCPKDVEVLEILKKENIQAGFFVIGDNIDAHSDILKQIRHDGHVIGNHSFSHQNKIGWMSTSKMKEEIEQCNAAIIEITGTKPIFYRPPFGIVNPNIARAIQQTKMISIGWSIRTYDTTKMDKERLISKNLKKLNSDGHIILMRSNGAHTPSLLQAMIDKCRSNGIEIANFNSLITK